jgi:Heterokaryon incompatibility protein (HET)
MDAGIGLTENLPSRTADCCFSESEKVRHTSRVDLPRAVEDAVEVQLTTQTGNLQDGRNSGDSSLGQPVDATEQISECPGAGGRWRVAFQIPILIPISLILGTLRFIFSLLRLVFAILLAVAVAVVFLILSPVVLYQFASKGFPSSYNYLPLQNPREIRLVQVQPGAKSDKVRCTLINGSLDSSSYEALSYAWGKTTSTIEVDGRNLSATSSLRQAITYIRKAQSTHTLWIDALCINQKDDREKSEQVQQMQDIYAKASRVIVWLGEDPGDVATAFQQALVMANASTEELPNILNTQGRWKESLKEILRRDWWERIWVIQEVVVARDIIVQCGDHTIAWDGLTSLLTRPEVMADLEIKYGLYKFVERVKRLRDTSTDPKYGLLSLVHDFRHKKSTIPHDKIYALRGLIKTVQHTPTAQVDYSQTPKNLWQSFAKEYINRHGSLFMLALVDSYGYGQGTAEGCSWCIDWTHNASKFRPAEELRQPLWDGGLNDQDWYPLSSKYSAAGGFPTICRTNLADPDVISVKGFVYDTVAAIGISAPTAKSTNIDLWHIFEQWEVFAGGPWTGDDFDLQNIFNVTLTAGNWTRQPNDWRYWSGNEQEGRREDHLLEYKRLRTAACSGRRLFITENGSTGLGHSDVRAGDTICVLLGADVPFILRKQNHPSPRSLSLHYIGCKRWKHIDCCIKVLHKIVGQAYIHDIMQYEGGIGGDIETGRLVLEQFLIE